MVKQFLLVLGLALSLSACMRAEPATRALGIEPLTIASQGGSARPVPQPVPEIAYAVQSVTVSVPRSLKVSEANSIKPRADIVWHGDLPGDRYAQVQALFEQAARQATGPMTTGRPVTVGITVVRFHAVTERTRRTIGGMHEMEFYLTLRDAATGAMLGKPRLITANVRASGGKKALWEEAEGLTQKVVVVERLVIALQKELAPNMPVAPTRLAEAAPLPAAR